jgi:hypothetical protein
LSEAPFVVVPGHHLDQRGVHDPGQVQVDDGGARSPTMSAETSGSSDTPRIPWYGSYEASCRNASLTS